MTGLGGLGSAVSESLLRIGLQGLYIVDYDVMDEMNIHRQILYDSVGAKREVLFVHGGG